MTKVNLIEFAGMMLLYVGPAFVLAAIVAFVLVRLLGPLQPNKDKH